MKLGVLLALALTGALLVMWATGVGPGTEQDSCTYVCAAQSLASKGALYNCDSNWPMNHFPPLYPTMLGIGSLSGWPPLSVARGVGAVSCGASIALAGAIAYEATSSFFAALLAGLSIICVGHVAIRYLYAMTEGPFIAFMLFFVFSLRRATLDTGFAWVLVSALAAGLACLTRYMGASLLMTGASVIFYSGSAPTLKNSRRAVVFATLGSLPIAAWLIRNQMETRSAFNRTPSLHPFDINDLYLGCTTLAKWAYPPISDHNAVRLGAILIATGLVALTGIALTRLSPMQALLSNLILCNSVFIVISRYFFDPLVEPHDRMLSPVLAAIFLLVLCTISNIADRWWEVAFRYVGYALLLTLLFVNARATAPVFYLSRVAGLAGTRRYYADSDLIRWVRRLPADMPIYSDEPEAIRLFAGHRAEYLPLVREPLSRKPAGNFDEKLAAMLNEMNGRPAMIVYFYKANPLAQENIPNVDDMPRVYHVSMDPVLNADEGTIYEARRAGVQ